MEHFKGPQQICPFMETLFAQRHKQYKDYGYGQANKKRRLAEDDVHLIDLSKFDEDDADQHQMKILFGCGAKLGFRGGDEHVSLGLSNVKKGRFPVGHPWHGYEWIGFNGMIDKTAKLTMNRLFVWSLSYLMMKATWVPLLIDISPSLLLIRSVSIARQSPKEQGLTLIPPKPNRMFGIMQNGPFVRLKSTSSLNAALLF